MKIKRFAVLFPLVFTLLLCAVPLSSVFADDEYDDITTDYSDFDLEDRDISWGYNYYNKEWIRSKLNYTYSDVPYYFYSVISFYDNNNTQQIGVYYITFNSVSGEQDSAITFSMANWSFLNFDSSWTPTAITNYGHNSNYWVYSKLNGFFSYTSNSNEDGYLGTPSQFKIHYQESNYSDFPFVDGVPTHTEHALDVSVSFSPDLSGSVNPVLDVNGLPMENNFFRYCFTNNEDSYVDHCLLICESGYDVLYNHFSEFSGINLYHTDSDILFILNKESLQEVLSGADSIIAKGSSEWRVAYPHSTKNHFVTWSQMNLQPNHNYDVVVLAFASEHDYVPCFGVSGDIVQEVYRSTFSLSSGTNYNPNDNSFGNQALSPGDSLDDDSFSAYYDSDGELVTGSFSRLDVANSADGTYTGGTFGGGGSYRPSNTGSSYLSSRSASSSVSSVSSNVTVFLQFLNRVFGYFPSQYQAIISTGLLSIVVLGVLKVVLK